MKMLNAAVVAVILAAGPARAEDAKLDFDGGTSKTATFTAELNKAGFVPAEVPAPVKVNVEPSPEPADGIKIAMTISRGGETYKDTLLCLKGDNGAAVKDCRKGSDGLELTKGDIKAFGVERFLMAKEPSFSGLVEKSRYCHNTTEECDRWKTETEKVCAEYGVDSHGNQGRCLSYETQYYDVCTHYVHYCED